MNKKSAARLLDSCGLLNKEFTYFGYLPFPSMQLSYVPPPVNISFAAWNKYTSNINSDFYKEDPKLVVVEPATIDNKIFDQDDPLTQQTLRTFFKVHSNCGRYTILTKLTKPAVETSMAGEVSYGKFEENITIDSNKKPLHITIDLNGTNLQKLLWLVFKPPIYSIKFIGINGSIVKRLNSSTSSMGFYVGDNYYKDKLYTLEDLMPFKSFILYCEAGLFGCPDNFNYSLER